MYPKERFIKGDDSKQVVLWVRDEVVDPRQTLNYIANNLSEHVEVIKMHPDLGHRIPLDVFEAEVKDFFNTICH